MYKLVGKPYNLTATVVSITNLESLYWSHQPPIYPDPQNITVNDGNTTTTTIMILKANAKSSHTLYAGNECGHSSTQIEVYAGKKVMGVVSNYNTVGL